MSQLPLQQPQPSLRAPVQRIISPQKMEKLGKSALWIASFSTVGILIVILGYIFVQGMGQLSLEFLLEKPRKMGVAGGIFPSIVGTIYFTVLTIGIATPIGVGAAIFLTEYTREGKITKVIRFGTEALAGIPSIVFGLFGFAFFVTILDMGFSILSGALTGATMILPTIVRTSEEAIKTVPPSYREGSYALGAGKWQTIRKIVLPSALPGIVTGIILGVGRVVGETAALLLTLGGSLLIPKTIFDPASTMSLHLYLMAMEVGALNVAFGTATVLIITIFIINMTANQLMKRFVSKMG